jgi:hypothetical protein
MISHPAPNLPFMDVGNFRVFNKSGFTVTARCADHPAMGPTRAALHRLEG